MYECNECDFKCKSKRGVQEHFIKFHKYKCIQCNTILPSRSDLKQHVTNHKKIIFVMPTNPFVIELIL